MHAILIEMSNDYVDVYDKYYVKFYSDVYFFVALGTKWHIIVTKLFMFFLTLVPNSMFILIKMFNPLIIVGAKWHVCLTKMSNI